MNRLIARIVCSFAALAIVTSIFTANAAENGTKSGFHYYRDAVADVPWSIQVMRVERSHPDLQFHTVIGHGDIAQVPLPNQLLSFPAELGRPIAAINGDYYLDREPYLGDPKGLQVSRGELISAPCDWTCLWFDTNGHPQMSQVSSRLSVTWPDGTVLPIGLNEPRPSSKAVLYTRAIGDSTRTSGGTELILEKASSTRWLPLEVGQEYTVVVREVRPRGNSPVAADSLVLSIGSKAMRNLPKIQNGAVLRIKTATEPALSDIETAIGGGPALLRDGKVLVGWSAVRHPRSAIGWNKDYIYMVQVDGRQRGFSVGMTYSELADYMKKLGCDHALNLDGGGSATFWALGNVMNSPSEGKARPIGNSLVLVQQADSTTNTVTLEEKAVKESVD